MGSILQCLKRHKHLLVVDEDIQVDSDQPQNFSVRNGAWDGVYWKGEVFIGCHHFDGRPFNPERDRDEQTYKVRVHRILNTSGCYNDVIQRFEDACTEHKIFGF